MTHALTLPSTREEDWRWSDLSVLPALAVETPRGGTIDPKDLWLGCGGPRLLFVDGAYVPAASAPGPVTVGPVDARTDHPLGTLAGTQGWTLTLGAGQAAQGTIEILHVGTGGANHLPAHIALGEGAEASIVESFAGEGWANRFTRIDLAPEARLMRAIRLVQRGGFVSLRDEAGIAAGASLVTTSLGAGGADSRIDVMASLDGVGAYAEYGGALLANGTQRHDGTVVLRHAQPGGTSRQLWRAVADEQAAVSLAARVEVVRDAQRTDAEQSLRGLLLKRSATINLKPELEIYADDVKAAHGAAVGELDAQALFYLATRGLPPAQARALLTRAFVSDALMRVGDAQARDALLAEADAWLGGTQ